MGGGDQGCSVIRWGDSVDGGEPREGGTGGRRWIGSWGGGAGGQD